MHLYVIVIFLTHANTLVLHAYDICISLYIIIGYVCCCILYIYKYTYICEHTGILCCLMCVRVYPVDAAYKKLHLHIRDRRYLYSINTDVSGTSVLHVNDMCTCVPTCALCKCRLYKVHTGTYEIASMCILFNTLVLHVYAGCACVTTCILCGCRLYKAHTCTYEMGSMCVSFHTTVLHVYAGCACVNDGCACDVCACDVCACDVCARVP